MTPKNKKERRILWLKMRYQNLRLWLWCVLGITVVLCLPDLSRGIAGATFYKPNFMEAGIALGLGLFAVMFDEKLNGGKLAKTPEAYKRMRNHAVIIGFGILSIVERLMGSI